MSAPSEVVHIPYDKAVECIKGAAETPSAFEAWLREKKEEKVGRQGDRDGCPIWTFLTAVCPGVSVQVDSSYIHVYNHDSDTWVSEKIGRWADDFVNDLDTLASTENEVTGTQALSVLLHEPGWEYALGREDEPDDDSYDD